MHKINSYEVLAAVEWWIYPIKHIQHERYDTKIKRCGRSDFEAPKYPQMRLKIFIAQMPLRYKSEQDLFEEIITRET